ncbi:tyrosine recombinase XerC [Kineosporia sp. A_224]|uniref:site-specific integrase n=1 Tax=Kineosporia sp. A_224 TaxID=1962180 RepID=UPI000B4A80EC|nr:site-specific integrase [Kineosporia sp. A_224]
MTKRTRANGEGSIFPYRNGYGAYTWVTTPAGLRKRKYVYGQTREIVHTKWIALTERARHEAVTTSSPTLGQYIAYWLRDVIEPNRAPLTHSTYETMCRLYIVPGLGQKRLDKLAVRDVQTWLTGLRTACQCCAQRKDAGRPEAKRRCCAVGRCCHAVLAPRSIRDLKTILRSALSNAVTEEVISKNVAALVKVPNKRTRKAKAWSSDEARAFLESAREGGDPMYAAFVLVLVLGLRKGEVLGLGWEQVDLDGAGLLIEWQVQRVRKQLLRRETKTEASDAGLPLPGICVSALRERRRRQQAQRLAAGSAWGASAAGADLVFTSAYGTPIDPRNFNRAFAARCDKASVRRITVHDARRTCATLLVDLDVHPRVIMQILRHAQFAVTMEVYAQASSPATTEALRRLGETLSQQSQGEAVPA